MRSRPQQRRVVSRRRQHKPLHQIQYCTPYVQIRRLKDATPPAKPVAWRPWYLAAATASLSGRIRGVWRRSRGVLGAPCQGASHTHPLPLFLHALSSLLLTASFSSLQYYSSQYENDSLCLELVHDGWNDRTRSKQGQCSPVNSVLSAAATVSVEVNSTSTTTTLPFPVQAEAMISGTLWSTVHRHSRNECESYPVFGGGILCPICQMWRKKEKGKRKRGSLAQVQYGSG